MADRKLTPITELTAPSQDDWLYVVDKSDTTDDAAGSSRKMKLEKISTPFVRNANNPTSGADTGLIGQWRLADDNQVHAPTADRVYAVPFIPARSSTITEIWTYVNTADAGSLVRLGIYNANQTTGEATTLVSDLGTMSTGSVADKSITGLSISVEPQLYWWAWAYDSAVPRLAHSEVMVPGANVAMDRNTNVLRWAQMNYYSDSATTPVASGFDADITSYAWSVTTHANAFYFPFASKWTEP